MPVASEYGARTSDRVAPAPGYVGYAAKLAGGAKGRHGLAFGRLKLSGFRFLALPTRFPARWDAPPWSPSSTLANAGIPPVLAWAGCLRPTSRQAGSVGFDAHSPMHSGRIRTVASAHYNSYTGSSLRPFDFSFLVLELGEGPTCKTRANIRTAATFRYP